VIEIVADNPILFNTVFNVGPTVLNKKLCKALKVNRHCEKIEIQGLWNTDTENDE